MSVYKTREILASINDDLVKCVMEDMHSNMLDAINFATAGIVSRSTAMDMLGMVSSKEKSSKEIAIFNIVMHDVQPLEVIDFFHLAKMPFLMNGANQSNFQVNVNHWNNPATLYEVFQFHLIYNEWNEKTLTGTSAIIAKANASVAFDPCLPMDAYMRNQFKWNVISEESCDENIEFEYGCPTPMFKLNSMAPRLYAVLKNVST